MEWAKLTNWAWFNIWSGLNWQSEYGVKVENVVKNNLNDQIVFTIDGGGSCTNKI